MRPLVAGLLLVVPFWLEPDRAPAQEGDSGFARLIGKKAPELTPHWSMNGQPLKLSDLRGKVVLVDFWAVWCGPCIRCFPVLRDWTKNYKEDGFEILGVTTYHRFYRFDKDAKKLKFIGGPKDEDDAKAGLSQEEEQQTLRDFVRHHKLKHRIVTLTKEDYEKSARDYGRSHVPHAVLVDRLGIVRMIKVGASDEGLEALESEIKKLLAEK